VPSAWRTGPAGLGGHRPLKAERGRSSWGHEGVEEADRIVVPDEIIEDVGEENRLAAIGTDDVGHGRRSEQGEHWPNRGTHNIWKSQEFSHRLRSNLLTF
jgi:hypothetical protein